jgi:hypothetical protein
VVDCSRWDDNTERTELMGPSANLVSTDQTMKVLTNDDLRIVCVVHDMFVMGIPVIFVTRVSLVIMLEHYDCIAEPMQ